MTNKDKEIEILIRKNETLKDEIAELQAEADKLRKEIIADLVSILHTISHKAVNEFANRIKQESVFVCGYAMIPKETFDKIAKEMAGD